MLIFGLCLLMYIFLNYFITLQGCDKNGFIGMTIVAAIPYLNLAVLGLFMFAALKVLVGDMIEAFHD